MKYISFYSQWPTFWFRVFGYGLYFEWSGELTFSERMQLTNYLRLGKYVIRTLKPCRTQ